MYCSTVNISLTVLPAFSIDLTVFKVIFSNELTILPLFSIDLTNLSILKLIGYLIIQNAKENF